MNFKSRYPYIDEYHRLGRSATPEGRKYMEDNQEELDKEYSIYMDTKRARERFEGIDKIHPRYS